MLTFAKLEKKYRYKPFFGLGKDDIGRYGYCFCKDPAMCAALLTSNAGVTDFHIYDLSVSVINPQGVKFFFPYKETDYQKRIELELSSEQIEKIVNDERNYHA